MEPTPNDPRYSPPFGASSAAPFRTDVAPAWSAYAKQPARPVGDVEMYGDAAGEYMRMQRGRYSAMVYVAFAFVFQIGTLFAFAFGILALCTVPLPGEDDMKMIIAAVPAGVAAIAGAWWCYRDRWRCIEAFSSRFCSGVANLSAMYVPIIAWGYANYRVVQKLRGR